MKLTRKDDGRFGYKLREARKAMKYSQAELCELTGVSIPFYKRIESGKAAPSIFIVTLLARELGTSLDYLTSHIETPREKTERLWKEYEGSVQVGNEAEKLDWTAKRKVLQDLGLYPEN